jgi:hypothetical protein
VSTEAEQDLEQKAEETLHGDGKCTIWERALQTKFVPVHGELSFALSGQFSSACVILRRDKQRIRVNSRKSRFPSPQTRGTFLPFALGKNKAKG